MKTMDRPTELAEGDWILAPTDDDKVGADID